MRALASPDTSSRGEVAGKESRKRPRSERACEGGAEILSDCEAGDTRLPCKRRKTSALVNLFGAKSVAATSGESPNLENEILVLQLRNDELSLKLLEAQHAAQERDSRIDLNSSELLEAEVQAKSAELANCHERLAELAQEQLDDEKTKTRLHGALDSYRKEVTALEGLIEQIEGQHASVMHSFETRLRQQSDQYHRLQQKNNHLEQELLRIRASPSTIHAQRLSELEQSLGGILEDFLAFSQRQMGELSRRSHEAWLLGRDLLEGQLARVPCSAYESIASSPRLPPLQSSSTWKDTRAQKLQRVGDHFSSDSGLGMAHEAEEAVDTPDL